jgi:2-(1,2-epoxy-1,2-dihydrophenyl)acetyl-CoA isomerase
MTDQVLTMEVVAQVATITFNRPSACNALDIELAVAFRDACRQVAEDVDVRAVLLQGAGRAFMAGGDLNAIRESPVEALNQLIPPVHEAVELLTSMPKPVVAVVQGAAAGAGLSIALAADFVVAAESARLSFAYSDIAASGDAGVSWTLPRLVGLRKALHIAMLGQALSAEQALQWGLISEVVPAAELSARGNALALQLAVRHTYALGQIKRLMRSSFEHPLSVQLQREHVAFVDCAKQPVFTEALEGFFAKRAAK